MFTKEQQQRHLEAAMSSAFLEAFDRKRKVMRKARCMVSLTLLIVGLFIVRFMVQRASNGYSPTPPMVPTPRPSPRAIVSTLVPTSAPITSVSHPTSSPSPVSALQLGVEILQVDRSKQVALRGSSGLVVMEAARFLCEQSSKASATNYASQVALRGPSGVVEMGAATMSKKTGHRNFVISCFFRGLTRWKLFWGVRRPSLFLLLTLFLLPILLQRRIDDDPGGFDPEEEENEPVTDNDDDLGGCDPEEEENEPVVVADPVPGVPGPPPPTVPQVLRRSARIRSLQGSIPIRKSLRLSAKGRVDYRRFF